MVLPVGLPGQLSAAVSVVIALATATLLIAGCPSPGAEGGGGTGGPFVYAAGYSVNSSNVEVPGYWKNGTWNGLTPLVAAKSSLVNSLMVSGSDVYAAGYSINSSTVEVAGYWKNGIWN